MSDTDQMLKLASAGDASATRTLFMRYRDRLRRMVAVHLDPRLAARVDPSDIVQETLGDASHKLLDYLHERPVAFYPWLRQIAKERLVEVHRRHLRAQRRSVLREVPFAGNLTDPSVAEFADRFMTDHVTPSQEAVREELRRRVREALCRVDPADRELLLMRHLEQMRVSEIADVLGIGERAAKSRLRRALERLQAALGPGLEGHME